MKLKLVNKKIEVPGVISFIFERSEKRTLFIFEPEEPIFWKAGQFLRYQIEDPNPDERGNNRFFTISAAPYEGHIMLTTRFDAQKLSSFKKFLNSLEIGQQIQAQPPSGSFTLDDTNKQYVFIAGGIGITPFRAIILELAHQNQPINVTLLYANRTENVVFKGELEQVTKTHPEFKIHYFISEAVKEPSAHFIGDNKIDESTIKSLVPDLQRPIFYISGPEPMVQAFEKMLAEMGILDEHIKRDYFPGYTAI